MNKSHLKLALTLLFLISLAVANSQNKEDVWQNVDEALIPKNGIRYIQPTKYRTVQLNIQSLKTLLDQAPMQNTSVAQNTQTLLELPMPDGSMEIFNIVESPIMEPELSEKFPEIKTYFGISLKNSGRSVRFDLTPAGFHAMILTVGEGTIYIDPYSFGGGDIQNYITYYKKDFAPIAGKKMVCGVVGQAVNTADFQPENAENRFGSCELRTYRLALAATGEYTQFHGGTVSGALAAQVTSMNRVNAVFNRDAGIQMNMIGNNNLIIYTNGATDPYTNNNGGAMLNENQTNIDAVIGTANYDIGHVFSTGGGGIAQLFSPCNNGKSRGVTGGFAPVNDPFDIDYVCHEIGHQFGANHTQNNNCQRNTGVTSVEPGSASSIMGYAGICAPNVQSNSDDHFHGINLEEISAFITSGGHTCPTITQIPNTAPTITGITAEGVTVPGTTPFSLTATATDPDANDVLSYCWEQMDADASTQPPLSTSTVGPNFRSLSPTTNPTRYFPNLPDILAGNNPTWEVLSSVSRTMNFRVTVRDNNTDGGAGCTDYDDVTVTIDGNSGPFLVTNPTVSGISWTGLSSQNLTWDVAGTDVAPVSCSNVDILLSTDGGLTYPTVLASNTPNDGSHVISIPNIGTTTARVMVFCSNNIFFDISNNNFTITAVTNDYSITTTNASESVCPPTDATYTIDIGSIGGYSDSVTLSMSGVPTGAISSFSTNPVTPEGASVLTISNTSAVPTGDYNLTVTANSTSGTKTLPLSLVINESAPPTVTLLNPTNEAADVALTSNFNWSSDSDSGTTYVIDITTDADFSTIIDNATVLDTTNYSSTVLNSNTQYFWRVIASNGCGTALPSTTFEFTTGIPSCDTISNYDVINHTPNVYSSGIDQGYISGHNQYGDIAKADFFNYTGANTHIVGAYIGFGVSVASNAADNFDVKVWDGTGGTPGTELVSVPVTYQSIQDLITGGENLAYIAFGSVALPASKEFFVGIEFSYGNSTIALITNSNGETSPATAWEKWADNSWHPYDYPTSWGLEIAHNIQPSLATLPTANFTPSSESLCVGSSITFTNTSTNAATYEWSFPGGTPATSTAANPTVTYSAPGIYDVILIATNDCISDTLLVTNSVTINALDDATFNYSASGYCIDDSDPTPIVIGLAGGIFSSTAGLSLNANSGTIDLSASTPGTYTITYTTSGTCPSSSDINIEVYNLPVVTFTAPASPYCPNVNTNNLGGGLPTGGVYSGPGVIDDGNGTSYSFDSTNLSGEITITYTFTDGNACTSSTSGDVSVVDTEAPQIVCPEDEQVNLNSDGTYTLGDYIGDGTATVTVTDNCTQPITIFTQDPAPGTILNSGIQVVTFTAEDDSGYVSNCSFELDVQETLGANDREDFASIILYPNPAHNKVFLSNPKQLDLSEVTIYDLTGKRVNVIDLTNMGSEISIDISTLANTMYLLVIKGKQGTSTKSLIVKND
jgi:PKD repeat protein